MDRIEQAVQIVASYLAGAEVEGEELVRAVDLLNDSGRPEVERLRTMLAATPDWLSDCRVFKESLPVLLGMSREQREREQPGLDAHLKSCAQCRALFQQLKSRESGGPEPGRGPENGPGPPGTITVRLDGAGGISRVESPATMELPATPGITEKRDLLFEDPDTGSSLTLTLQSGPQGISGLDLALFDSKGLNITSGSVTIEPLGPAGGPSLEFKSLAEFRAAAPELGPGVFRVGITGQAGGDEKDRAEWRFELNLETKD